MKEEIPREVRMEMLLGHMGDVLAEMRSAVGELRTREKNVRINLELRFVKQVVGHMLDRQTALTEHVKALMETKS